ncbi:MFS transporter [Streptomyces tubbatahanensis]|uniref:MFS transporter n=1 Tax=Streptomyces tubbatahanensis TaxID=2923272 RepID=A0ABY3XXC7_9ACTN|nr:MFS transporter [Streptomyces tubbatahanensis]UNS99040.1 MFS transporter [Streptomyces tubbatahanensis]
MPEREQHETAAGGGDGSDGAVGSGGRAGGRAARVPPPAPTSSPAPAPAPPGEGAAVGYGSLFRVREFRAVFAAHVLSLLGTVVAGLALPVLIYAQTSSPLLTALTFALGFLPNAVGGALLAPVADRFPARPVLVACDLFSAACVAAMLLPQAHVALLLALRAAAAFVQPLFTGVRAASLGAILPDEDSFVLGRSLIRVVAQSAQIVGNAATGLLLVLVTPRTALVGTVAGFLASALILRAGTRLRPALAGAAARTRGATRARGGIRALLADRRVRSLLLLCWLPPTFAVVPEGLAAPYADDLGAGPVAVGLLLAAGPVGSVAGELAVGTLLRPAARERLVLPLASALLLPLLVFALRPALPLALAALCASGLGMGYTLGLDRWFFDAAPPGLRGRALTVMSAGLMSAQGLGMAVGGGVAEFLPAHAAVALTGAVGTVCVVVVARNVRRLQTVPDRPVGSERAEASQSVVRPDRPCR